MKAAYIEKWGEMSLKDIEIPKITHGEALVKVKYAGICGTDLHVFNGHHPTAVLPLILGHEISGIIEDVKTDKDTDLKPGDNVVIQPYHSCGSCEACLSGRDNICAQLKLLGVHEFGSFAEYVKVPLNKVYKIPKSIDLKLAAMTEPLAVAMHDVRNSGLKVGDRALVIGGGPIGVLIALVARMAGAADVVISEVNEYRLSTINKLGFKAVNPFEPDYMDKALKITKNKGFDVVFEVTGLEPSILASSKACKIGGSIVFVGLPSKPVLMNVIEIVLKEINIRGVRIHSQVNFYAAIEAMEKGTINSELLSLVTNVFPLDEVKEAMAFSYKDGSHYKVVIEI